MNPRQARALLEAVRLQQPSGPRLVAFSGLMYYARPEEAISLRAECVSLPPPAQDDECGELHLRNAIDQAAVLYAYRIRPAPVVAVDFE